MPGGLKAPFEFFPATLEVAFEKSGRGAVEAGLSITRIEANRPAVFGKSLFQTAAFFERRAEIVMRLRIAGPQPQSFAIARDRFVILALFAQRTAEIVECLGKTGPYSDSVQQRGNRFRKAAAFHERRA